MEEDDFGPDQAEDDQDKRGEYEYFNALVFQRLKTHYGKGAKNNNSVSFAG